LYYSLCGCIIEITLFREECTMGLESELMTTKDAAAIWGITPRRVQILCDNGKVSGAVRLGKTWIIPKGTPKPIDGRTKAAKILINRETVDEH
jgi:hypothetical protein